MPNDRDRGGGRRQRPLRKRRKRPCLHCVDARVNIIDYKNVELLRQYVDERGRIRKARQTGACRKHQSRIADAIKRAREMALVEYVAS